MPDAYREDLALIHDAGYTGFAQGAADVLTAQLHKAGRDSGLVVDLGCGSGVLARALTDAGYDVLGIDLSAAMIALARRRAPRAEFRVQSLLTAELPPCIAVTAIGECFNYLFDAAHTPAAVAKVLRRIHRALAPQGVLLFDTAGPGRVPGGGPFKNYREGEGWAVLFTAEEDPSHRRVTRRITTFRRVGDLYRRDEEVHRLRLIPPAETAAQLRGLGFRVRTLRGYGEQKLPRGMTAFLARKA